MEELASSLNPVVNENVMERPGQPQGNSCIKQFEARLSHNSSSQAVLCDDVEILAAVWGERGVRKFMEDTHILCLSIYHSILSFLPEFPKILDAAVFAIFDGHGGKHTSTFVRNNVILEIAQEALALFQDQVTNDFFYTDRHVRKLLHRVFAKLDSRIFAELPGCKDGSTVILAFLPFRQCQATMYFASLGDTAAYLSRTIDGIHHAIPLNEIHKPWMVKEKARILEAKGVVESGRVNGFLEVSRSLGDISLKKYGVSSVPTIMKFTLDPLKDNFILLGCDGFWVNWTAVEAISKAKEFLEKERRRLLSQDQQDSIPELQGICQELVNHVLVERKSQDNVTLIMLYFNKIESFTR